MGSQYRQEGRVRVVRHGQDVEMFYREAVGLVSRGLAEWSKKDDSGRDTKAAPKKKQTKTKASTKAGREQGETK